jgi:hypothetical protein
METDKVSFNRKEKSILVDILRWYKDEYDTEDEQVDEAIEMLEESSELDIRLIDSDFISENVIGDFSEELKPYLADMEDGETAAEFFVDGFKNISKKLKTEKNPFKN